MTGALVGGAWYVSSRPDLFRSWWEAAWSWGRLWWAPAAIVVCLAVGVPLLIKSRYEPDISSTGSAGSSSEMRSLSSRSIVIGAMLVLGIGVIAAIMLLRAFGGGTPSERLDAIRTAGTIVVGTGGGAALLLAARQLRATELTLAHQREVALTSEHDATERRITELYTKAADQLGADKAAVRLAGLYALERLGQSTDSQRETIGNLICAYLRMPHETPDASRQGSEAELARYRELVEEQQVRRTALSILVRHCAQEGVDHWEELRIDLAGANLANADLAGAQFDNANLSGVNLGMANLAGAQLRGANLSKASLLGAWMLKADLSVADLRGADLGNAFLVGAWLRQANLHKARLAGADLRVAWMVEADLRDAMAEKAVLTKARLENTKLAGASFVEVKASAVDLDGADAVGADFSRANLTGARMYQTKLKDAKLTDATVKGAHLTGTDLTGADLAGVDLEQAQLRDVVLPAASSD